PFSICIHNQDGVLINANPAFEKVWDVKIEDLIGKFNLKKEKSFKPKKFASVIANVFKGQSGDFISQFETPKGNIKDLHVHYFPLKDAESNAYNIIFITEDITARLSAEKEAVEGEAMKQSILDSLEDALLVVNKKGKILSVNQRLQNYLARSKYPSANVGDNVLKFLDYFEERKILKDGLENVLNRTSTFFDYEVKLADRKWYNLKVTQLKKPTGAVISWQNINTRKEIEIALEKSLKKYRNIYNRAPVMMHSMNAEAEIMSVSDFWLEKMGYERKEVIGKKITDFLADESFKEMQGKLIEFYKKKFLRNEPYHFKTKNGEIIEVLLSAASEYDEMGNFERSLTGMVDVTELRNTERALKKSQRNLIDAQRISKIGNYELNLKNYFFNPSAELTAMLGFDSEASGIQEIGNLVYPDDRKEFIQKLDNCRATGEDFFHVFRILHLKTGKTRWISGRGKIVSGSGVGHDRMVGTFQDISEQRVAEEKIQRLSDRILLATELAKIGVWEHSEEDQEVYWDKNMFEIFDPVKTPIKGVKELSKYIVREETQLFWGIIKKIKLGFRFVEGDLKVKVGGGVKYLKTHTRIIRDENDKISRVIGVLYDITEDKKLQLKLESSLEEKNILLKEVHHRVKNNMQLVSSILALKSYDLNDEESKRTFDEVNERIKSMAVIHDQLYKFYNVSEINIAEYLNHIAGELSVLLGTEKTEIKVEADDKQFDVDKMLLFGLIVSELVSNAFKHSFKGMNKGKVQIIFKTLGSGHNYLAVLNDGKPIPQNIFDNESSGLGLSLIKTFVKQLNGLLSIHPENGIIIRF
ncbi:MAG: PAS domain S-box protein, partial [Bacteroidota bacterium]